MTEHVTPDGRARPGITAAAAAQALVDAIRWHAGADGELDDPYGSGDDRAHAQFHRSRVRLLQASLQVLVGEELAYRYVWDAYALLDD